MRLAWLVCLVCGCRWQMALDSSPVGARVTLPSGEQVIAPAVVAVPARPFRSAELTVSAPGYRTMVVDIRSLDVSRSVLGGRRLWRPATWSRGHAERVVLLMVPEHGAAGSWEEPGQAH